MIPLKRQARLKLLLYCSETWAPGITKSIFGAPVAGKAENASYDWKMQNFKLALSFLMKLWGEEFNDTEIAFSVWYIKSYFSFFLLSMV